MPERSYISGELYELDLDEVTLDPQQPRSDFDENEAIDKLTSAIRDHRFLQPVFFRLDDTGRPTLLLGGRRYKAARNAGLTKIPAIYCDRDQCEVMCVRNLLLADLTPVQEAEALRQARAYGYSPRQLGIVLGRDESDIRNMLSLLRLPADILDACRNNPGCDRELLLELAALQSEDVAQELFPLFAGHPGTEDAAADKPPFAAVLTRLGALARYAHALKQQGDAQELTRLAQGMRRLIESAPG